MITQCPGEIFGPGCVVGPRLTQVLKRHRGHIVDVWCQRPNWRPLEPDDISVHELRAVRRSLQHGRWQQGGSSGGFGRSGRPRCWRPCAGGVFRWSRSRGGGRRRRGTGRTGRRGCRFRRPRRSRAGRCRLFGGTGDRLCGHRAGRHRQLAGRRRRHGGCRCSHCQTRQCGGGFIGRRGDRRGGACRIQDLLRLAVSQDQVAGNAEPSNQRNPYKRQGKNG
jgi:hypothetical protein